MEKTNFTFVRPLGWIKALSLVLFSMGWMAQTAQAQCTPPANVTVTPNCNGSVTISWNAVPAATSYTVDVEDGLGLPVVNFVNMPTTSVTITPGTLTPGTPYPFAVTANCGISTTSSTTGTILGAQVYDLPPVISITNVVNPSCPTTADGSFKVTVNDACGASYNITSGGTTFPAVAAGTQVMFMGQTVGTKTVTLTLAAANGCNYNAACVSAVSAQVTLVSADVTDPTLIISDASGANPPSNITLPAAPEGECGTQLTWTMLGFDNCGVPTVTATISSTTANPSVTPDASLVLLNNAPTWAVNVFVSVGVNTLVITATDADGNSTQRTFTITLPDARNPVLTCPSIMNIEIPSCDSDDATPVNWVVSVDDDCDLVPAVVQTGGPTSGSTLGVGNYNVSYQATDDWGNTSTCAFSISVVQDADPDPIVDISGNGNFNVNSCEANAVAVFTGNVYACGALSAANLSVAVTPLTPGAIGTVLGAPYTLVQNGFMYFEYYISTTPGNYLVVVTYDGVSVDGFVIVEQDSDDAAQIIMPGNSTWLLPACETSTDATFSITICDDCDDPINAADASFFLGGAQIFPTVTNVLSNPGCGYFEFELTLDAGDDEALILATYEDGAGNFSSLDQEIEIVEQPDNFAPIVVYPSQDINVELDPCDAGPAIIFFEVTAVDNCDGQLTPSVVINGQGITAFPSIGGDTYGVAAFPGVYQVIITATDGNGNTTQEDFFIVVTQDPAPVTNLGCNDDINVTLDANCQRVIAPDMVLEGNFGCLTEDDFEVTIVNDLNPNNGNILDGCGQFIYEIDFANLSGPTVGFTGDFAAQNWSVNQSFGGMVSFSSSAVNFTGPDGTFCSGGAEASIAIAVPTDGNVSFDYDYTSFDSFGSGFDAFIALVDANGTVTVLVNTVNDINAAGSVDVDVNAGDVLVLGVASADCVFGPGAATVDNFVFTPAQAAVSGFIPCWGYVSGEDKTDPIIDCPDDTDEAIITETVHTLSGSLTTADPSIVLNNYSCFIDGSGTQPGLHYYELIPFQVNVDDYYTFYLTQNFTGGGFNDGFVAMYQGSFDPNNPCENIIAQSDDNLGGNQGPVGTLFDPVIRITLPLRAQETYYLFTSTWDDLVTGPYTWIVYSDGPGWLGTWTENCVTNPDWSVTCTDVFTGFPTTTQQIVLPLLCEDEDFIFNNPASVAYTGNATATDNCSGVLAPTFTDAVTGSNGDCGPRVITRTFYAEDDKGNDASCTQDITIRKPTIGDVQFPSLTAVIECDEDFDVLANGNPVPGVTGYPFIHTLQGIINLDPDYCNIGATYEDGPRIQVCEGAYKFIRTWTVIDWCNPGGSGFLSQIVKVGDYTPPVVSCPFVDYDWDGDADTPVYSTSPFSCTAAFTVPLPVVTDNCSAWEVYTEIVTDIQVETFNQYGISTGFVTETIVVREIPWNAPTRNVSGIPVGNHRFRYVVEDDCGNETILECPFIVEDGIEPVAVCDDDLNISIGGSDGINPAIARVFAEDIDEGSWDNCEIDRIEVRRNKFNPILYTCGSSFSNWGPYVDFFCCDIGVEITIEMRVIDKSGNINICWLYVVPEDKVRPYCYAPHDVQVDCDDLPYDFDASDTDQLAELFGEATATDNCAATPEELSPIVNLHDCGFGTITRRFQARDLYNNISVNTCRQVITIREVHNYEIKFPEDGEGQCGSYVADSVTYEEIACDLLAVGKTDEQFSASGDECFKIFRTWKVINWCQYDGESAPFVVGRDEDCDGNPGDECVWVLHRPGGYTYIDRDGDETEPNNVPLAFQNICNGIDDFWRKVDYDGGYYQYTQHIRVYDDVDPAIDFTEGTFCSYDNVNCDGLVTYPFTITELCTPTDLTIKIFLDANADGTIDADLTNAGVLSGSYPNYTITGEFPIGCHAFEVHVEDGCGNTTSEELPFCVEDCKSPSPVCINGLAIELMPFDVDGDDVPDEGRMATWAIDFIASPVYDCTGPVKYSINRAGDPANIDSTGIVLTCDDLGTLVVEIWAWDGAGNADYCETYILVQDNMGSCTPAADVANVSGAIATEEQSAVENVGVSLSGQGSASMNTAADGEYAFSNLTIGYDYTVTPSLDGDYLNGVSTFDLVLISKHILGVELLNSPYKRIAADVNNSESITTLDLIQLRKVILSIDTEFEGNTSWRFVERAYAFPDQNNPWFEDFPEVININNIATNMLTADFVAVKIGDVNLDAETNSLQAVEDRNIQGVMAFEVAESSLKAGNEYTVTFNADLSDIAGYQATLTFDNEAVEVVDVINAVATEENFGMTYANEGMVTTSWNGEAQAGQVFSVVLRAKADAELSEVVGISSRITKAEAYNTAGDYMDVAINFSNGTVASAGFELYQNTPNPFKGQTVIGYNLPADAQVTLTISDVTGKVLMLTRQDGAKGYNQLVVNSNQLPAAGVLYYTVETAEFTASKKMIIIE